MRKRLAEKYIQNHIRSNERWRKLMVEKNKEIEHLVEALEKSTVFVEMLCNIYPRESDANGLKRFEWNLWIEKTRRIIAEYKEGEK